MRIEQIRPVTQIETNKNNWKKNKSSFVDDAYKLWLSMFVAKKYWAEFDQLYKDKDNACHHPHVQTRHVGDTWHRPKIIIVMKPCFNWASSIHNFLFNNIVWRPQKFEQLNFVDRFFCNCFPQWQPFVRRAAKKHHFDIWARYLYY